jgi:hypothetical protein
VRTGDEYTVGLRGLTKSGTIKIKEKKVKEKTRSKGRPRECVAESPSSPRVGVPTAAGIKKGPANAGPFRMELVGLEPTTFWLPAKRSPS